MAWLRGEAARFPVNQAWFHHSHLSSLARAIYSHVADIISASPFDDLQIPASGHIKVMTSWSGDRTRVHIQLHLL